MKNKKSGRNRRLFSPALFRQSCKANGIMWGIITLAVCFMLSCVMLISGGSNISSIKEGMQDTIIERTIEATAKKSSVQLYDTADSAEKIFDEAFAERFAQLNTEENYKRILAVTNEAEEEATSLVTELVQERVTADVTAILQQEVTDTVTGLVTDKVTNFLTAQIKTRVTALVTEEVTARLTAQVKDRVTELVTEEVTARLTAQVKARVEALVTEEVTQRLTAEVAAAVQDKASEIAADVQAAVAADMQTEEAVQKIEAYVASGMSQEDAVAAVTSEYLTAEQERITAYYTQQAQASILTESHKTEVTSAVLAEMQDTFTAAAYDEIVTETNKAKVTAEVLNEKQTEYTEQASAEILTDSNKENVTKAVLSEKQAEYTEQASAEILTDSNKEAVKEHVLSEYQDAYVQQATNSIVTDAHKQEVADRVLAEKESSYVQDAKDQLAARIDAISEEAKEQVTELITDVYLKDCYQYAVSRVEEAYPEDKDEAAYGAAMVTINPDNQADEEYTKNGASVPEEYISNLITYLTDDIMSWENGKRTAALSDYITTSDRDSFRHERAYRATAMLVAANLTDSETKREIIDALTDYNVDEAKYDSMGFTYDRCETIAYEACQEFQSKYDYEISKLPDNVKQSSAEWETAIKSIHDNLMDTISGSFLDILPEEVRSGIEELGTMDLYGLIVGSIFFKMAGLLLPIIYIIMVSNNLIASQVDTGSMAYVLSTSAKRNEVTFTQAMYLIGSILLMFVITAGTSCVCFRLVDVNTKLTYEKLLLINLGAFVTMYAVSGINFYTSCYFDRSKRAMALGGGISIFFLVATMLGLFGSHVIPSVVRIEPLNYFNYFSLISLFDVISILEETGAWIPKLCILAAIGTVGYIAGSVRFRKKDLPL